MTHKHLFFAFLRVGLLGYGGGPAAIPLVQKEVVENYKWMTDDEFSDMLAMGNTLPGPIATKLAGYVGYRVSGIAGMLNALAASVLPTVILMVLLLTTLSSFRDLGWVQGMTRGVIPVVAVLLGVLTWGFIEKSNKDLGWLKVTLLVVASVVLIQLAGIHPAVVIAALIIFVLTKPSGRKREGEPA